MRIGLKLWRQAGPEATGRFVEYVVEDVTPDMSFLEMLDLLNERLVEEGKEPVAFDSDCREGICGACSLVIDGVAHGPGRGSTTCELRMRAFEDGASLTVEPFRAGAFPLVRDLVVDRSAFDRIIEAGGFVSVDTGSAPEAQSQPVPKPDADLAFEAATCIGCGACVAACRNASAKLFVAARVSHLALLPQGRVEARDRAPAMVAAMDAEGFGACTNTYECEAVCPKEISTDFIARLNREHLASLLTRRPDRPSPGRSRSASEGEPS